VVIHLIRAGDTNPNPAHNGMGRSELQSLANQTAYNVSQLLDNLLQEYDNSLRPDFGGGHTLIEVNMQVQAWGRYQRWT